MRKTMLFIACIAMAFSSAASEAHAKDGFLAPDDISAVPLPTQVIFASAINSDFDFVSKIPDTPTASDAHQDLFPRTGFLGHMDVPIEAREKIATTAQNALQLDNAKQIIGEVNDFIYRKSALAFAVQIEADAANAGKIETLAA